MSLLGSNREEEEEAAMPTSSKQAPETHKVSEDTVIEPSGLKVCAIQ